MNHFCEKCGNEIKPEDKYCEKCGNGVNGTITIKETNTNPYAYRALAQKSLVGHLLGLIPLFVTVTTIFYIIKSISSILRPSGSGAEQVIPFSIFIQLVFLAGEIMIIITAGIFARKIYSSSQKKILELGIEEKKVL